MVLKREQPTHPQDCRKRITARLLRNFKENGPLAPCLLTYDEAATVLVALLELEELRGENDI